MKFLESVEAVVAGLTALVSGIIGLSKMWAWFRRRRQRKARAGILAAGQAAHTIYAALSDALSDLPVQRVMVLECHNGGGVPQVDSQLKASIRYEIHGPGLPGVRDLMQDFPLDAAYNKLLLDLRGARFLELTPANMDDGFLKDLYVAQEVQKAYIAKVGYSETGMFYLAAQALSTPDRPVVIRATLSLIAGRIATALDLLPAPPKED